MTDTTAQPGPVVEPDPVAALRALVIGVLEHGDAVIIDKLRDQLGRARAALGIEP